MKAKYFIVFLAAISLMMVACKEEKTVEANQMKSVMSIHDEVMPKMGTIGRLMGDLSELEADSTAMASEYQKSRKDLQNAHKSMMDWMKGFSDRFDPDEILNGKELTDQKQKWLDEEEVKVIALKKQINESIARAKKLLNEE